MTMLHLLVGVGAGSGVLGGGWVLLRVHRWATENRSEAAQLGLSAFLEQKLGGWIDGGRERLGDWLDEMNSPSGGASGDDGADSGGHDDGGGGD